MITVSPCLSPCGFSVQYLMFYSEITPLRQLTAGIQIALSLFSSVLAFHSKSFKAVKCNKKFCTSQFGTQTEYQI